METSDKTARQLFEEVKRNPTRKRFGFGRKPALINVDLQNAYTRVGEFVTAYETNPKQLEYVRDIYESLRTICVASRDNKPIGDKMILNAAFLLEREREAEFDAAVNRVAKKFGERLNFKYTGPWPPYNFVNIRLKLEPSSSG